MVGLLDRRGVLLAAALALWVFALGAIGLGLPGANAILRILLGAFALVLTAAILKSPSRLLVLTPLYLLGMSSLVFYSLVLAIYTEVAEMTPTYGVQFVKTASYVGSLGETLVLQFSAFSFALSSFLFLRMPAPTLDEVDPDRGWKTAGIAASAIVLGLALVVVAAQLTPWLTSVLVPGRGGPVSDLILPMMAFSVAVVARAAVARRGRSVFAAFALIAVAFLSTMLLLRGLVPLYIGLAPLGLLLLSGRLSPRTVVAVLVLVAFFVTAMFLYIALVRSPAQFVGDHRSRLIKAAWEIEKTVVYKVIIRQGVSGWCLDRIAQGLWSKDGPADPLYFASAVVPRVLWPDKPSISLGSVYAVDYCDMVINPASPHSEALTLMGEPIIRGGIAGLVVMQVFVGASLMVVTLAALRRPGIGIVALVGILPWLIIFEQNFAMYFANAVKMFLTMTPLLAVLVWHHARSRRRT